MCLAMGPTMVWLAMSMSGGLVGNEYEWTGSGLAMSMSGQGLVGNEYEWAGSGLRGQVMSGQGQQWGRGYTHLVVPTTALQLVTASLWVVNTTWLKIGRWPESG